MYRNDWLNERWKVIKVHIIVWCIFWMIDYFFAFAVRAGTMYPHFPYLINAIFSTVFFYSCVYGIIIPYYLNSRVLVVFLILVLISLFCLLKFLVEYIFQTETYLQTIKSSGLYFQYLSYELWRYCTMTFFSFAYWFYVKSIREEQLRRHTEQLLLKGEIDFLKAQINPHFLFNTLNLIYSEVSEISEKAGKAILSLTHLMRFSVESTKHEAIPLEKELEALEEYLDLQKLRFSEGLCLAYEKEGNAIYYSIPPLSLLSVVENAFKYGVISDPENPIRIGIQAHTHTFIFHCKNKIRTDFTDKETTAVGFSNLKRRLQMAFGKNMDLRVIKDSTYYETQLSIVWT